MDSAPGMPFPIIFALGVQTLTSGGRTFVISSVVDWGGEPAATVGTEHQVPCR